MVELHGWLTVSATYKDEDTLADFEPDKVLQTVKKIISASGYNIRLKYQNGSAFIDTLICSNHRTKEVDDIIGIYRHISEAATGSYGMIFLRDDEDAEHGNEFQVYVFKKGKCILKTDTELSPCIPTIEDAAGTTL